MVNTAPFTIDRIIQLLDIIVTGFGKLMDYMNYTLGQFVEGVFKVNAFTKPIGVVLDGILSSLTWNGQPINAIQLGEYVLGGFLLFYLGYVFLTWLLNIVT